MLNSGRHRALSLNQEAQRRASYGTIPCQRSGTQEPSSSFSLPPPTRPAPVPAPACVKTPNLPCPSLRCCLKPWRAAPCSRLTGRQGDWRWRAQSPPESCEPGFKAWPSQSLYHVVLGESRLGDATGALPTPAGTQCAGYMGQLPLRAPASPRGGSSLARSRPELTRT